ACSGALLGIDRPSGQVRWRCALPGVENRVLDLAIDGDLVVAACETGHVFGVEYASGRGRWVANFEPGSVSGVPPTILIEEGRVFPVRRAPPVRLDFASFFFAAPSLVRRSSPLASATSYCLRRRGSVSTSIASLPRR